MRARVRRAQVAPPDDAIHYNWLATRSDEGGSANCNRLVGAGLKALFTHLGGITWWSV